MNSLDVDGGKAMQDEFVAKKPTSNYDTEIDLDGFKVGLKMPDKSETIKVRKLLAMALGITAIVFLLLGYMNYNEFFYPPINPDNFADVVYGAVYLMGGIACAVMMARVLRGDSLIDTKIFKY